jgi:hypothetical protein
MTIAVYADTLGVATCRGATCRQTITWAEVVASGKKMCFSGRPVALRTEHEGATHRLINHYDMADVHWSTCRDRQAFKR